MKEERTEHVEHSVDIKKFTLTEKLFREKNVSVNFCNFDIIRNRVCNTDTEYRKPVLSSIPNTGIEIQGIPVFLSPKHGKFWVKFTSKL